MPTLGESFSTQVDLRPANSPAPEPPPSTSRLDTPRHVVPVDLAFADMFDPARQTSPDPGSVAPPKPVVAAQPRPLVEAPKPAVAEPPKPVAAQPRPLVEAPKPAVAEPRKPVAAAQPRAKVEAPKPAVAAQLPVLEASRPAVLAPTLAEPPNLAAPYRGEEDDEDDDEDFVPAFDLIEALARSGCTGDPAQDEGGAALEIVECRRELVLSVRHPKAGGPVCLSGKGDPIGAVEADGTFALEVGACRALVVRQAGRELSPAQVSARRDGSRLRLTPGMSATVDLQGEDKALVHWTPKAAALPRPRVSLRPGRDGMTTGALSVALHLGIGLFIGLVVLGGKKTAEADINAGRFATIQTKELELEPPPPTPPPETPPPEGAPTVDMAPPTHDQPVRNPSATPTPGPRRAGSDSAPASASAQKILSALGGAPSAISTDAIAVTNLDALPVAAGGFKVSGSVGKAPGDTLRVAVAAGGGREVDTKSASELGGNDLGRVAARGGEGGPVRARVTAAPQAIRGEGHLDRGEIQKVVNAHLYQVQGCYERQLAKDPSLSGKISYEWVVDVSGGVSSVRVGRSTVHSVEVTTCIQSAIQGWKFPPPSGGSVTVTYPFAFSSLGG
jgi:outer membrane biosynthesis protein TonB